MGWIENGPKTFLKPNFVRQGLPAKSQMVPFRFISLMYLLGVTDPDSRDKKNEKAGKVKKRGHTQSRK
jgi:hypothetical protein